MCEACDKCFLQITSLKPYKDNGISPIIIPILQMEILMLRDHTCD